MRRILHLRLVYLLETYCLASGLIINWQKSNSYWKANHIFERPQWTEQLSVMRADNHNVSKLLGAPFRLSLSSEDVNSFLFNWISKKLTYWVIVHVNPTSRSVIVNSIMNLVTFFLLIWGSNNKGVKKVK
jgi:hypothetical protein